MGGVDEVVKRVGMMGYAGLDGRVCSPHIQLEDMRLTGLLVGTTAVLDGDGVLGQERMGGGYGVMFDGEVVNGDCWLGRRRAQAGEVVKYGATGQEICVTGLRSLKPRPSTPDGRDLDQGQERGCEILVLYIQQ
jgi:hypothetical protein